MSFLDDVKRSYDEAEPKCTTVPEWKDSEGQPWVIYARQPTIEEMRQVDIFGAKKKSAMSRMAMLAQFVFRDANGNKLIPFQLVDKFARTCDSTVMTRVLEELDLFNMDDVAAMDAAEKNSEGMTADG